MSEPFFPGFKSPCRDVPEYVIATTRDVWERRNVAHLDTLCPKDVVLRSATGVEHGPQEIRAGALATLAQLPDRQLLAEDVIWVPTAPALSAGKRGFLASLRVTSLSGHRTPGAYGDLSGQTLRHRVIAETWFAENQMQDGWIVRDTGAIARQLQQNPQDWTREQINREGGVEKALRPLTPETDIDGPYLGQGVSSEPGDRMADLLKQIMLGDLSAIENDYDPACLLSLPGGKEEIGRAAAGDFWLSLRNAFPTAGFRIEHRMGLSETARAPRAAIRWSLYGRHEGVGAFGAPSGTYVYVMGITHVEFGPQGVVREWTLLDETAVWKQILLAKG